MTTRPAKPEQKERRAGGLAAEIGKRRPFGSPQEEASLNILRTASFMSWEFEQLLKDHSLSEATYNVLRILRGRGGSGSCSEIGADMLTRVPDVTRLIDRLERLGLAQRRRVPEDRRVVRVQITPKGVGVLDALDKPGTELNNAILSHMSRAELVELSRLLTKVRQGIAENRAM
jgi:DNA-binding MarR family transcriptional regulator